MTANEKAASRKLNVRAGLAAALCMGLLVVAIVGISPPVEASPQPTWSDQDVPVGLVGAEATPKWEVSIAIDPTNPQRMIASAVDNDRPPGPVCCGWRNWFETSIHTSLDGGKTWVDRGNAMLVGNDGERLRCNGAVAVDPSVAFDVNGVAYVSHLSYGLDPMEDCPDATVAVQTSTDGGETWNHPVVVDHADEDGGCWPDRDTLVADPVRDIVYLTWSPLSCGGVTQNVISASRDGGRSWSDPVPITEPKEDGYAPSPGVAADGTVYIGYYRATEFNGCLSMAFSWGGDVKSAEAVVAISRNHGRTWTRKVVGPVCDTQSQTPEQPFWGGADFSWPSLAVDPDTGMVGIAWSSRDRPFSTVHVSVSRDRGKTWSEVALADPTRSTFMPELAAAGGKLHLTYIAMNSSGLYDAVYRHSADGASWSEPFTLNTQPSCNCWGGVNGPGIGYSKIGDYIGIDARAGRVVAAWPDNRDPREPQNIYARVGTYEVCAPGNSGGTERGSCRGDRAAERASAHPTASSGMFKTMEWAAAQASPTAAGMAPNFIAGLMASDSPEDKTGSSTGSYVGARGGCSDRAFERALRRALPEQQDEQAAALGCGIETAFGHVRDVAEATGYRVALEDFEGFEAELLLTRGRSGLVLVKLSPSRLHAAQTDVLLRRLDY